MLYGYKISSGINDQYGQVTVVAWKTAGKMSRTPFFRVLNALAHTKY
jgi:hypothetical protein